MRDIDFLLNSSHVPTYGFATPVAGLVLSQESSTLTVMTVDERIGVLVSLLKVGRRITRRDLEVKWKCTSITVHRTIARAREKGFEIEVRAGRYHLRDNDAIELPGIRLGADELSALLGLTHWLDVLGSGILKARLAPIQARLEADLGRNGVELKEWKERIRMLPMHFRSVDPDLLQSSAEVTLQRIQAEFEFKGVRDAACRLRRVSPQSLVRYRDNWYLDAWDHAQSTLRCFALSRMRRFKAVSERARDIPRAELDAHFAASYGIFAGRAPRVARLVFSGEAARFVAEERWHPKQKASPLADGELRLEFPCGDIRELARDVMRYADEVRVLGPEELREAVRGMVRRAAGKYP